MNIIKNSTFSTAKKNKKRMRNIATAIQQHNDEPKTTSNARLDAAQSTEQLQDNARIAHNMPENHQYSNAAAATTRDATQQT